MARLEQEEAMPERRFSRRDVLKASTVAAAGLFASPSRGAAPEPTAITPALIEAAKKEGKVHYYTSIDLPLAEKIAKSFEAAFPGIAVRVERSGAERVFQRIGQEYASRIYGVDVVNSSDAAHFIVWKRDGLLAPFVPADVARHYPADHRDPDGMFASFRVSLSASPTTRTSSSARRRRRASPICSIRNGRARSSRRIRATAGPS
jgi:iron(III) transport system substrate-binding protein